MVFLVKRLTLRALAVLAAAVIGIIGSIAPVQAQSDTVDSMTIKWREDVLPQGASSVSDALQTALGNTLRIETSVVGRNRDGSFVLQLSSPQSVDAVRAAINRVRMSLPVIYANLNAAAASGGGVTAQGSVGVGSQPPVTTLMVKFRDATLTQTSVSNGRLAQPQLDQLSALAGQPLAYKRAMSGGAFVVRLFQALSAEQGQALAAKLETNPAIEYADVDWRATITLTPNDPLYSTNQWDLKNSGNPDNEAGGVNMAAAWDRSTGAAGVVVAVIDTGILPHPDLAGRYLAGYDMVSDPIVANDGDGRDADPTDPGDWVSQSDITNNPSEFSGCSVSNSSWHGTHVSGTIGAVANNSTGVAGINWVSKILPVRVLGKCGGQFSDIIDGITWAAGLHVPGVPNNPNPARVMNMSLGGTAACSSITGLQTAINNAIAAGSVIAVAAGNGNQDASSSAPGNCNGVITVAATGRSGQRASYSNFGSLVEIAAPGGADGQYIWSTLNIGATVASTYIYAGYQGTSMATPHVAGIASLILSVNPSLTPAQVLATIQNTARAFPTGTGRDCTTALCGAGIINAAAALASLSGTSTTTTLVSSPNPSTVGSSVVFTATVTGGAPTGSVAFAADSTTISGCSAVAFSGGTVNAPTATCNTSGLAQGTHSIVATYSGDAGNSGSTSTALSQVVNSVAPPGALVNPSFEIPALGGGYQYNPSASGIGWAFASSSGIQGNGSAWGAAAAPNGSQTAFVQGTGSMSQTLNLNAGGYTLSFQAARRACCVSPFVQPIQVSVDGVPVGGLVSPASTSFSNVSIPLSIATTGAHTIAFTGTDPSDKTTFIDIVTLASSNVVATTTTLGSSPNPSTVGASVVFTATVNGSAPSGTVAFTADSTPISGCSTVGFSGGTANAPMATCSTSTLSQGTHGIVATYSGDTGNSGSASAALSQVVNTGGGTDVVWVEDSVPAGATATTDGGDVWNWISSNPAPYAGALAHQSVVANGEHQHYFYNATATLTVASGDTLFGYVYLDPANLPSEVMLQWNDGSWEHRAYWGANLIAWGTDGTVSRQYMGALPAAGQWVRLAVPAAQVGLVGSTLNGMAYTLYGGRATWDHAGKTAGGGSPTATTTALGSSPNPSTVGSSVAFTATVNGSAPSGTVAFTADSTPISGCSTVGFSGGTVNVPMATCSTSSLSQGVHSIVATYSGDAGNSGSTGSALSQVVNAGGGTDVIWVEDSVPAGATATSDGGDVWNWISSSPPPYAGALAHQSVVASGEHQHYFYNATATLTVGSGDTLFGYVYLDPANLPSEVMLQWNDGSWEHRAYWGANLIAWGTDGTVSRQYMGALPAAGQWVRLAVPAAQVGLVGSTLNGMAYTIYGGRATWDHAGKTASGP